MSVWRMACSFRMGDGGVVWMAGREWVMVWRREERRVVGGEW